MRSISHDPPIGVLLLSAIVACAALALFEKRWCYQIYFAARAITTIVTITNAAICTQKLLARPPLLVVCRFIGITSRRGF